MDGTVLTSRPPMSTVPAATCRDVLPLAFSRGEAQWVRGRSLVARAGI